jgi:electron transfer flavoprotein beta subunit
MALCCTFAPQVATVRRAYLTFFGKTMKFLVCISQTPDTTAKVTFTADGTAYNAAGQTMIMNPYDEWYALVRACELAEADGGTVVALNVGPAANEQTIRKALAIGATEAVRVDAEPVNAEFVAHQIAAYAQSQAFDVILLGKETIDYNGAEVGAILAELLDLPYVSNAAHLTLTGAVATLERDIEGGVEVLEVETPFVLSAAKGLAEQRIPNMRGIMMARSKPLQVVPPVPVQAHVHSVQFVLPPAKTGVHMIKPDNIDELVRLLHEEAKVI